VAEGLAGRWPALLLAGRDDGSLPPAERPDWRRVKGLDRSGLGGRGGAAARRRLARALAAEAPGVVHVHNLMDPGLLAEAAATGRAVMTVQDHRLFCPGLGQLTPAGEPCGRVLGEHCLACFREPGYGRRLLALTRRRLAAAAGMAALTTLSAYMAGELARAFAACGLAAPPIRVIPPWPRLEPGARPGAGEHHLLASRLVERKGVRQALAAAAGGRAGLPLVVAGDGPLAGEVAAAAEASGGWLRYVGWAGRAGLAGLLARARSLWLPSLWAEPFGIAGLEALAAGAPVVACPVGGVGEWLEPGVNGLAVPPGDAAALAAAGRRLAAEPELAAGMGRAGVRRAARDFAAAPLLARLESLYLATAAGEADAWPAGPGETP
jgi:glycosyltransferase involved in cell wall biosynthesis